MLQYMKEAERAQNRLEMEEYEKRKNTIKEDLKKQYNQLLIDNQKIADLRSDKVIEEEVKAQELHQAVLDLKQGESPESVKEVVQMGDGNELIL